jgi:hypothetical protein
MPYSDKEKQMEWKRRNRERVRMLNKKSNMKCRDHILSYRRKYSKRPEVRKRLSLRMRDRTRKKRLEIVESLGSQCAICGFIDLRALQIDHVNGGGNREKKEAKGIFNYYQKILKKVKEGSKDYQLLCANHNIIKKFEKKEWGHKYE